jgi:hypothetical protein
LSKQAEIPSSCGKGQGLHIEQKSGKQIQPFFFGEFFKRSQFLRRQLYLMAIAILDLRIDPATESWANPYL